MDLDRIKAMSADDTAKRDLELICLDCGEWLCDVEAEDSLATLMRVATEHGKTCDPLGLCAECGGNSKQGRHGEGRHRGDCSHAEE